MYYFNFMGTVVQLKKQINNSYFELKNSVEEKLILVEEKIKNKLTSDVNLVQKMSDYQIVKVDLEIFQKQLVKQLEEEKK